MSGQESPVVSVVACETYDLDLVRQRLAALLVPLGGIQRFVRPGMYVLLKPNLLKQADPEQAVTTHVALVRAVAESVIDAGADVMIGDSPAGPAGRGPEIWHGTGMEELAGQDGIHLVEFDAPRWERLHGQDYFVAGPALDADLVINLPKLKTHAWTLYTGAVKNLLGVVPGTRKRDLHYQAPGMADFARILVDILELVQPGLTIVDGVLGQEGNGPGSGGTPHHYGCLVASMDPVAADAAIAEAMGYRLGEVLHLAEAGARALGMSDPASIRIEGDRQALNFGSLDLPKTRWYFRAPPWAAAPVRWATKVRPQVIVPACVGCGRCSEVCPRGAIVAGTPPTFDLGECIGCLCCAEICPQGAIEPHRNLIARLIGLGC